MSQHISSPSGWQIGALHLIPVCQLDPSPFCVSIIAFFGHIGTRAFAETGQVQTSFVEHFQLWRYLFTRPCLLELEERNPMTLIAINLKLAGAYLRIGCVPKTCWLANVNHPFSQFHISLRKTLKSNIHKHHINFKHSIYIYIYIYMCLILNIISSSG